MAKIIQFPGNRPGPAKVPSPKQNNEDVDGPPWAGHVGQSPLWNLSKTLFEALLEGPINTDKSGGFSPRILDLPESDDLVRDIEMIRTIFVSCGFIAEGKRSISLTGEGFAATLQMWTLWPRLFSWCRDEGPWESLRYPGYGGLLRELLPRSLGFLRAATEKDPLGADTLIDLALYNLDIASQASARGIVAALDDVSRRRDAPMDPLGAEWFHLTLEACALPLGLVLISTRDENAKSSWMGRPRYAALSVQASELLLKI